MPGRTRYHRAVADPDDLKLPRGRRGLSLSGPMVFRILFTAALLFAVIVLRQPCADATGRFVNSFDPVDAGAGSGATTGAGSAGPPMPGLPPGAEPGAVIPLGDLSEAEVRAVYERLQREAGICTDAAPAGGDAAPGSGADAAPR